MKPKINMSKLFTIIVTIVFFLVASLVVVYVVTVDDEMLEATRIKMENSGFQMGSEIEGSIEESTDDLSLIAEYASDADITVDTAADFLRSQSQAEEFENIYYVDLDGNGISADNVERDFSQNETFIRAFESDIFIDYPYISPETEDLIFELAVPVVKDGVASGVLFGESPVEDLYEIIDSTVNGGWIFLTDTDLNIHFTTSVGHTDDAAIPSHDIETLGHENVSSAIQNVVNGIGGSFTYIANYGTGNTQKILFYYPIEMTDWVLAIAIEENAIHIDFETAIEQIVFISIVILLAIVFFVVYIWIYRIHSLKSLERTAYIDPLTGLPNLLKLKKDMSDILTKNRNSRYAVVKIDIENFKAINEMFGFEIGNRVLQAFKPIRETVPEPTLMITRTGVDEFILFSGNGFLDDMEERTGIYESYYKKFIPELGEYKISFKYGRYHIPIGSTDVDDIINKLNLAHKISKENKGLIIHDYNESYTKKILKEAELTKKMSAALQNNEFLVYLQPKYNLSEEKIIGAEALVRWQEADGTMIFPNDFIPLFEKNGFIIELDRYILEKVCITIRKWIDEQVNPVPISVNCSRQNLQHDNFVQAIRGIADKYDIPHGFVEVELTETATIANEEIIETLFSDLRQNGFGISIDDFGAGYSSLGLLKNLKVDTLKMDRSFFTDEKEIIRAEHVVDGFIKLAHKLDMYVVAEGIETIAQIEMLKKINCDAVQGYYYSKPMPIAEFEEKYKDIM